jgi:hypothetical protein
MGVPGRMKMLHRSIGVMRRSRDGRSPAAAPFAPAVGKCTPQNVRPASILRRSAVTPVSASPAHVRPSGDRAAFHDNPSGCRLRFLNLAISMHRFCRRNVKLPRPCIHGKESLTFG